MVKNATTSWPMFWGCLKKNWDNVISLICDSTNTDKYLSTKAGIPFMDCGSRRFNIPVWDVLAEDEESIENVNATMLKLRSLLRSYKLRRLVPV